MNIFKKFINWLNRSELEMMSDQFKHLQSNFDNLVASSLISRKQLSEQLAAIESNLDQTKQQLDDKSQLLQQYQQKEAELLQLKNGTEPWVEIKAADFSTTKGIGLNLDWNDGFIKYLQDNGITGDDDEQIVQKWLLLLYRQIAEDIEAQSVDATDLHQQNKFE